MFRATLRTTAAVAVAALVISPLTAAYADWTGPTAVPEGPEGSELEAGKRLTSDLAVGRDGHQWFVWVLTDDTAATITNAATQRVLVSSRPDGGAWQPPTELASAARAAGSNYSQINDVEIDVDAAGNPTVAWNVIAGPSGNAAPTGLSVVARTRTGGVWGAPSTVGSTGLTVQVMDAPLSLDVAPDGQAALAWQADAGVHLARRTGGTWGAVEIADAGPTTPRIPDTVGVGIDRNGTTTLAWRAYDEAAAAWDVRARSMNSGGGWGTLATLDDDATLAARTDVAVDATGAAVATWGTSDGARAATRTAAGVWGGEQTLSTGSANAAATPTHLIATYGLPAGKGVPSAAFDPYGVASVVWPEVEPSPRVAIAAVGADGQVGAASTLAEGSSPNTPVAPRIVLGRDGATAVWSRAVVAGPGGVTGGQVEVAERDLSGTWSVPTTYTQPGGTGPTVLGLNNHASLSLAGDALGDALAGWTSFQAWNTPNAEQAQTVSSVADRTVSLEWTARGVAGSNNIRSWLNYLRTNWGGTAACPVGGHGIEVSGAATMPSPRDDSSWRFTQTRAYRYADGRQVVQYAGTLRWVLDAHCIDVRITNPRLEIAADGATARLYADGQTSASMEDVLAGNPSDAPFTNLRILDIDLAGAGPRAGGDTRTWLSAPARLNAGAASKLGLATYAGHPFGYLTVTAPAQLSLEATPPEPPEPPEPSDPSTAPVVSVSAPAAAAYGTPVTVQVGVPGRTGDVHLTGAGATRTATLVSGTATFRITGLRPGRYPLSATYAGVSKAATLTVTKARQTVRGLKVLKAPKPRKVGRARITVATSTGVKPGGRAVVTLTKGKITRKVAVRVTGRTAVVRLPKLSRGVWKARARIGATGLFAASPVRTVKIRVR